MTTVFSHEIRRSIITMAPAMINDGTGDLLRFVCSGVLPNKTNSPYTFVDVCHYGGSLPSPAPPPNISRSLKAHRQQHAQCTSKDFRRAMWVCVCACANHESNNSGFKRISEVCVFNSSFRLPMNGVSSTAVRYTTCGAYVWLATEMRSLPAGVLTIKTASIRFLASLNEPGDVI